MQMVVTMQVIQVYKVQQHRFVSGLGEASEALSPHLPASPALKRVSFRALRHSFFFRLFNEFLLACPLSLGIHTCQLLFKAVTQRSLHEVLVRLFS